MKTRRALYVVCLLGLATVAVLAVGRLGEPSVTSRLLAAALLATAAGSPGLFHRRAWPVALVLLPLGAYLAVRLAAPLPPDIGGLGAQFGHYAGELRAAADAYAQDSTPLDLALHPEVSLLMVLIVYATTGLASFLALSRSLPVAATAVLLVPFGFGLTVDGSDTAAWLAVLFLLSGAGMLLLSRSLKRSRWRATDILPAAMTAVAGTVLAFFLLGATSVSAGDAWWDWRAWGSSPSASTQLSFDWTLNYPGLLEQQQGIEALEVTSPVPSYWRANALDYFDGAAWRSGRTRGTQLWSMESDDGSRVYQLPAVDPSPTGETVTARFRVASVSTDHFLTIGSVRRLTVPRPVSVRLTDQQALEARAPLGPGFEYEVEAVVPRRASADLVGRGRDYPADVAPQSTLPFPALPGSGPIAEAGWTESMGTTPAGREWLDLLSLNRRIVGDATDPYEVALRIERHLRTGYAYSLSPPASRFRSPYAAFLFDTRTGYCQHFAGSMALLLRFNGVPARVALGFTTGDQMGEDTYLVDTTNAHAWVEAYFPGSGWVTFDPTPGRSVPGEATSSTSDGFADPYQTDAPTDDPTAAPDATTPEARGALEDSRGSRGGATSTSAATGSTWLVWGLSTAGVVVVWPFGRAALRRRRTRRGTEEQRLAASLAIVRADLAGHGVPVSPSDTLRDTAQIVHRHLALDASEVAARAEEVLYGGRAATADDVAVARRLRRDLGRRLRARIGWRRSLLAAYGLPVTRGVRRRPASYGD